MPGDSLIPTISLTISYLKRFGLEKPEVNITESHSKNDESNKGSRNHEVEVIDDPKKGGKTSNIVQTELDVESTDETYVGNAWNGHVSSNKADIINDDKDHEKECEYQITGDLKETDNDIEPAKVIMAEIILEKKDNNTDRNQIQWNAVEVWETNANSNNAFSSSLVEQGIDALSVNWLDTDEESDIEIYWDAESCKEDENLDCKSESE